MLDRLIEAYRERDSEAMQECCNNVVFRSMDNEVCLHSRTHRPLVTASESHVQHLLSW